MTCRGRFGLWVQVPLLDQQIAQVTQATMKYYGLTACKCACRWLHTTDTRGYRARHSLTIRAWLEEVSNLEQLDIQRPGLNYDDKGTW